jgi:GxxExxY protein
MLLSMKVPEDVNAVANAVYDAIFKVHRELGPGLLESSYRRCLQHELTTRGFLVQTEVPLPLVYEGLHIGSGYRVDLMINGCVLVELKATDLMHPVYQAQLLTYLKLSGLRLGSLSTSTFPSLRKESNGLFIDRIKRCVVVNSLCRCG